MSDVGAWIMAKLDAEVRPDRLDELLPHYEPALGFDDLDEVEEEPPKVG